MKETIIQAVLDGMRAVLTENQLEMLTDVTRKALSECEITPKLAEEEQRLSLIHISEPTRHGA